MQVTLLVHLERAAADDGEPTFVWWAESPSLDGFSAAADHLPDLLDECDASVVAILREQGVDEEIEILPLLAAEPESPGASSVASDETAPRTVLVAA